MNGYAELAALSNFTFLEGASHPHELVAAACALGHAAIGIADRNSFAGLVRGHVAAAQAGLPFIPGCRLCLDDGTEYLAWPTDRAAYGRLSRLLSEARMHVAKGECRITRDALIAAAEGLVLAIVPPDAWELSATDTPDFSSRTASGTGQPSFTPPSFTPPSFTPPSFTPLNRDVPASENAAPRPASPAGRELSASDPPASAQVASLRLVAGLSASHAPDFFPRTAQQPRLGLEPELSTSGSAPEPLASRPASGLSVSSTPAAKRAAPSVASRPTQGLSASDTLPPTRPTPHLSATQRPRNFPPRPPQDFSTRIAQDFPARLQHDFPARLRHDFPARVRRDAAALNRRLALPLFVAARHLFAGDDRKRLDALAQLGAPLLAAGATRFHTPSRRRLADVVAAIRLGLTVDALGYAAHPNAEAHLKPAAEMRRLFAGHADAVANTLRVVAACRFSMADLSYEYPDEILDPGCTPQQTLERRTEAAAAERWPDGIPAKVAAQLTHELELIGRLGYAPYFLTVHEIVRYAQSQKILCQGRGSAANSAVCYALGITSVAPDKHDLLFERFISASRNEPPDIDVDFEHERREEVIQHIYARYGRDRAAIAATVIRYRERSAIREVGRAMGLSDDITRRMAKAVWHGDAQGFADIATAQGLSPENDPRLKRACELADELTGFPRHLATHVGGFVITRGPLTELAVVTKAAMADRHTIEWDKDDIEALRILKVDVLGLGMLTCIRRAFALIEQHGGPALTLATVPQDDPETYAMLRRADSLGVFQVESRAQMNMLPRLRPEKFYDLVIEVAIVRPGPIQGDMVHPYLRRRNNEEPVTYPSAALKRVLEKTLGVPLFQEQAMQIAIVGAGFPPERADQLRRAMATFRHVGTISLFRTEFLEGMARNGYAKEFAERCFQQIEGFGTYGFPESHAASFAGLVYVSSWIKCHHPAAFAAALLNSQPMGFYAPAQIVRDAREHGVEIRPIDVTASDYDCTLEDGALRLGLRMVEGLNKDAAKRIEEKKVRGLTPPETPAFFWEKTPSERLDALVKQARLTREDVRHLAEADALRGLQLDRRTALWEAAAIEAATPIQHDLLEPTATLPTATAGEQTVLDYGATGLTLRHHPLALLRPHLDNLELADTRTLNTAKRGAWIRLPGLVLVRQRPGSAKGVVFFTVEDEHGVANLVLYPDRAKTFRAAVVAARLVVAEGRVERHEAAIPIIHLLVHRLTDRSDLLGTLSALDTPWRKTLARADEVERGIHHDPRERRPDTDAQSDDHPSSTRHRRDADARPRRAATLDTDAPRRHDQASHAGTDRSGREALDNDPRRAGKPPTRKRHNDADPGHRPDNDAGAPHRNEVDPSHPCDHAPDANTRHPADARTHADAPPAPRVPCYRPSERLPRLPRSRDFH